MVVDSAPDNPPGTEFKPQYTVKAVKHGAAKTMAWGCFHTTVWGQFIVYQRSWISLNTSKYLKRLCESEFKS